MVALEEVADRPTNIIIVKDTPASVSENESGLFLLNQAADKTKLND